MSAQFLQSKISEKVLYSQILSYDTLQVTTARRTRVVYIPFNNYNGTADIVAAAKAKRADTVACPKGMAITEQARAYGRSIGIAIHSIREFIVLVENERSVL
ncbi:MAG: hypothetical protein ABI432_14150 [Flavobacteriales bacterium]